MTLLQQAADWWWQWMVAMSWQVALVVAAVWVISLVARRSSARFRYLLWCLVLLKLCLPPGLAFVTGIGNWLPAAEDGPAQHQAALGPVQRPVRPVEPAPQDPVAPPSAEFDAPPMPEPMESAAPVAPEPEVELTWTQIGFLVWLGGVAVMAGLLLTHLKHREVVSHL